MIEVPNLPDVVNRATPFEKNGARYEARRIDPDIVRITRFSEPAFALDLVYLGLRLEVRPVSGQVSSIPFGPDWPSVFAELP